MVRGGGGGQPHARTSLLVEPAGPPPGYPAAAAPPILRFAIGGRGGTPLEKVFDAVTDDRYGA